MKTLLTRGFWAVVLFLVLTSQARAYSPVCTHPNITGKMTFFYLSHSGSPLPADYVDRLMAGAHDEDTRPRWLNHFYDPVYNRGWSGDLGVLNALGLAVFPSIQWAISPEAQNSSSLYLYDCSWPTSFSYGGQDGFFCLGHIFHLLEDASVPAHTRNDTHISSPGFAYNTGDWYELWAEDHCQELTSQMQSQKGPANVDNLVAAMTEMAKYSNSHFVSNGTIGSKEYPAPLVSRFGGEVMNGEIREYAYALDENGKEYHLARKSIINLWLTSYEYYTLDPVCLRDTWNHVSPLLLQYGAGVIDLYLRSVDAKAQGCFVDNGYIDCSGVPDLDGGVGVDSGIDAGVLPSDAGQISDISRDASDVFDAGISDALAPDVYYQDAGNQPDSGLVCQDGEEKICAAGLGVCAQGRQICVNNQWSACQQEVFPNSELCDGLDNDCDGQTDEDFLAMGLSQSCSDGIGACRRDGAMVCASDKKSVTCSVVAGQPVREICGDKIDDDCDGQTDEVDECPIQPPVIDAPISGVIPDVFSYLGGKFQIHVSPTDPNGQLIIQNISVKNFSFSQISAARYLTPSVIETNGQARVDSVEIKVLTAPGKGATLLLMLDSSGSMTTSDPDRKRVEAGKAFVDAMSANDRAAVLDFGTLVSPGFTATRLLQDLTTDKNLLKAAIDKIVADDGTPLYDSLMEGLGLIEKWSYSNPSVLVLTDGQDTASTLYGYIQVIAKAQQLQTPLYIVPLGDQLDFSILQAMADQSGGALGEAYSAQKLIERFKAAGVSMRLGKIVVHGSGTFSPPLTNPDRYLISGVLDTSIGGADIKTPFEFSVDIRQ